MSNTILSGLLIKVTPVCLRIWKCYNRIFLDLLLKEILNEILPVVIYSRTSGVSVGCLTVSKILKIHPYAFTQVCTICDVCFAYHCHIWSVLWQSVYTCKYFHKFLFLSAFSWCQAVGSVYSGLQVLSERSAMVTRALDYIGDILKHIKPSLVSKNQEGLQLAYWAVGRCSVQHIKHWTKLQEYFVSLFLKCHRDE